MTTRHLTLNHQTRLAINIVIEDDTGMLLYSILLATRLFTLFWRVSQLILAIKRELSLLAADLRTALDFTAKVFVIGFNSLAYGFGVTL